LNGVESEAAVDGRAAGGERGRAGVGMEAGQQLLGLFLFRFRSRLPTQMSELRNQLRDAVARYEMGGEAAIENVGGPKPDSGEPEIAADTPGTKVQKPGGADIGEQPDSGFRHRQKRALGGDPEGAVDGDPGAAAHRDAIDDREVWLRIAVDVADDLVLFAKEHRGQLAVAGNAPPRLV